MGLFGKGKKELLEWQNLIIDTPINQLVMSEKQLQIHSKPIVENRIRILNDSTHLCNTTKNPDVFFPRYDLLIEQAQILSRLSKFIKFEGTSPENILKQVVEERPTAIRDFINRCFDDAELLKTNSAKAKRYQKILLDFRPFRQQMGRENLEYLDDTCTQRIENYTKQTKSGKPNAATDIIKELNKYIQQAQAYLDIQYDLKVNPYYLVPIKTTFTKEPLTKTGREPKYPTKFHYETPMDSIWQLGDAWLLPDGSIGKASAIAWINHCGYMVKLALQDGSLIIKKIEITDNQIQDRPWKTVYKA